MSGFCARWLDVTMPGHRRCTGTSWPRVRLSLTPLGKQKAELNQKAESRNQKAELNEE